MSAVRRRLFAALLRLYPEGFRREYGEDVLRTLEERADVLSGSLARARFTVREGAGLARGAAAERRADRRRAAGGRRARRTPPWEPLDLVRCDVAQAVRRLLRTPSFTATAVTTLALAIAANAAIFTLVWRVVVAPLPYPEAGGLVALEHTAPGFSRGGSGPFTVSITNGLYREYRARVPALEASAMTQHRELSISGEGREPERIPGALATPTLTRVLRVEPALGRWFTAEEGAPGGASVVVLSHGYWREAFGGDPAILGRRVTLDGVSFEVIGVMPSGFDYPRAEARMWLPLRLDPAYATPGGFNYRGVGRLREGATVADLARQMDAVIVRLPEIFPDDPFAPRLVSEARLAAAPIHLKERVLGGVERALWIVLGAVGLVLLVACANVATLFLARLEARQRELAVRRALGASRRRVALHFLAESAVVAGVAGAVGAALAAGAVRALVALSPVQIPRLHEVRLDGVVLLFTLGLAAVAALAFGALPLLQRASRLSLVLREGGRGGTAGRAPMRARSALVAAQTALAVMLLVASGLLARSFQRLMATDPGFATESRLVFRVGLPGTRYPDIPATSAFHYELLDRIQGLPGVVSASATTCAPLAGICYADPLSVAGRDVPPGVLPPTVGYRRVGDGFAAAMGLPLLRGRDLAPGERGAGDPVLVNQALVDAYFPDEDPIGKRVFPGLYPDGERWLTVVGVVGNAATYSLQEESVAPQAFLPLMTEVQGSTPWPSQLTYVVETSTPPLGLVAQVRRELSAMDDALPLADIATVEDLVARDSARMAFTTVLLGVAAALGLLLGIVGTYGVISYAVAQRRNEIGVRLALGARPGAVAGMVLEQGTRVAVAGVALGLVGALALSRTLEAVLYGVSARDPLTYAAVASLLLAVALLASWLPARRAAAVDPAVALRSE